MKGYYVIKLQLLPKITSLAKMLLIKKEEDEQNIKILMRQLKALLKFN